MNSTFDETNHALDLLSRYLENGVCLSFAADRFELQFMETSASQLLEALTPELQTHLHSLLQEEIGRPLQGGMLMPLSWIQRRHYFVTRYEGAEVSSTVPHALRFSGKLDRAALSEALLHLQRAHAMLRTSVHEMYGVLFQWVAPTAQLTVEFEDLSHTSTGSREAQLAAFSLDIMRRPFQLDRGVLLRPVLVKLSDEEHVLLLPLHHLIADGLSLRVINDSLLSAYENYRTSGCANLPTPSSTYADFIHFQHSERSRKETERHLNYWIKRMAGKPAMLSLPTDKARPVAPSYRGRYVERVLDEALTNELIDFAKKQHVTPFMLYSAAFHILLARYSGQSEVTLGYPFGNRIRREDTDTVGLFVNTLLQRVEVSDDPVTSVFLTRVKREILLGTGHHRLQFDKLLDALDVERSASYHPMFQAFIGYYGQQANAVKPTSVSVKPYIVDTGAARFDLELFLRPQGGETVMMLWAQDDLFRPETSARMLAHLENILKGMLAAPEEKISSLSLLSERESGDLLRLARGGEPLQACTTILEQIAYTCRAFPDRVAVRFEGQSISFRELDAASWQVARSLIDQGVKSGDVVAVQLQRSAELPICLLGILKAGAAYMPLDPLAPQGRVREMLDDCCPRVLIVEDSAIAPAGGQPWATLSSLFPQAPAYSGSAVIAHGPASQDLAYVIFTSGSTGRPKGVMNTHEALLNRLAWMQKAFPLQTSDVVVQKTPLTFDVSVWEVFWPLMYGATLLMAKPEGHKDPEYLGALFSREQVSVAHFVPSMLSAFVAAEVLPSCTHLKQVICSGEALSLRLAKAVKQTSAAELHNLYGPTEAAIDVTWYTVTESSLKDGSVPIGRAIDGLEIYILDENLNLVPPGVVGEIHIGGIGLARGYINQPALTAQKFIPSPFSDQGARLYRTGDLGKHRWDGQIEYLGRNDNQVKLRGFRIELGDIETALMRLPIIREAVVTLNQDTLGHATLAAFLASDDVSAQVIRRAREALSSSLPEYMIPSLWSVVEVFSRLQSGKVDRSALPTPTAYADAVGDIGPLEQTTLSGIEQVLATAWAHVLGRAVNHRDEDFFHLGGDSIRSIELVVAARRAGLQLSVEKIFQNSTLSRMAQVTTSLRGPALTAIAPFGLIPAAVQRELSEGIEDAFPLSRLMTGLYYESVASPDYHIYTTAVELEGAFVESVFKHAVALLMRRHPFLRSSIDVSSYQQPLQLIHRDVEVSLAVVDISEINPADQAALFKAWFDEQRTFRFQWDKAPLFAMTVHRHSASRFTLTLAEPYLDGWSVTLVISELLELYQQLLENSDPVLEPVSAQGEFLLRETNALNDPDHKAFWAKQLVYPHQGQLPFVKGSDYRTLNVPVSSTTSDNLKRLAQSLGVSIKAVLLSAHLQVIAFISGRTEVITGLMSNSRPETTAGMSAVGMFLNTLPLRINVAGLTRRQLIQAVHAFEAQALPFRNYPFAQMLSDAGIDNVIDSTFNYTHFRPYEQFANNQGLALKSIRATDQTYHSLTAQFRLDVLTQDVGLFVEFSNTALSDAEMKRIASYYEAALLQLATNPGVSVCPLDKLAGSNAYSLLVSPPVKLEVTSLIAAFDEQCQASPQSLALLCEGRSVSYASLSRWVDKFAETLCEERVEPGSIIGICVERSAEYVVAVLATLRLAATYMPLDHTSPTERLGMILNQSRARLLIVSESTRGKVPGEIRTVTVDAVPVDEWRSTARWPLSASHPAVLMYTSGSTGTPKGVLLHDEAILTRLQWSRSHELNKPSDVFVLRTPVGFVDGIAEMFDGLLRGVPTVILPDRIKDPVELMNFIQTHRITKLTCVPAIATEMFESGAEASVKLATLDCLHLSGELLKGELVEKIRQHLPRVDLINLYGSTEVCADATVFKVQEAAALLTPVGFPIPGAHVMVEHEGGGYAPIGTPGELLVGGQILALGYFEDASQTAQRFMPSLLNDGGRVYRTGDIAVLSDSGDLNVLGRADRQIKIRGIRIEPAEIEAALKSHAQVAEALTVQRESEGRKVLVAYVRPAAEADMATTDSLIEHLSSRVLIAAIPDVFITVESWPLLPSGKIDINALPVYGPQRAEGRQPDGLIELELVALWEQRLKTALVSVDDDFFQLGGNSLSAIILAGMIGRRFGVSVNVSDIFDHRTLAKQAHLLEVKLLETEAAELVDDQ
ncbi:amino acid adenylation enzyme/thioester reductase family protein [Pseudomonas asplenii]|uniref:Amino acid adenylation enzyme/thioester reductase family protein n=1 Tax=Pseudomonas asplenii TaxID=53407 RepID=A0A0N1J633_9PSED|nr:non-ribosomal peptide synthetase [Pseudomonas fuscovaginae]KPA91712.1 amino acid adenylation enzyme/thioester reductase family protein [Pseudomonas fuscovaginae]